MQNALLIFLAILLGNKDYCYIEGRKEEEIRANGGRANRQ
jgi:hypothetical protein